MGVEKDPFPSVCKLGKIRVKEKFPRKVFSSVCLSVSMKKWREKEIDRCQI
jgi:hypothetical protein